MIKMERLNERLETFLRYFCQIIDMQYIFIVTKKEVRTIFRDVKVHIIQEDQKNIPILFDVTKLFQVELEDLFQIF